MRPAIAWVEEWMSWRAYNILPRLAEHFDLTYVTAGDEVPPASFVHVKRFPRPRYMMLAGFRLSNYVDALPPVLIVRATPKLKEKFWTTVGRMAASTQGVALPPFKKMQDSFASMRLYCGQSEITPIHPFRIERRLDNDTGLFEGLYVFDPASLGPQCHEAVKLVLFSEKSPAKGDEHVVDPKTLEQLANDFALVHQTSR